MPAFRSRLSALALAATLALPAPVHAGPLVDAATAAEAALASGDLDAWIAASEALAEAAWSAKGLYIALAVPTTGDAPGFGMYQARANTTYRTDEPITIYLEPRGFGYGDAGGGVNEIAFDIDLVVKDGAGTVLAEMPNFTAVTVNTRARTREMMVNLTATLNGAPPGDYVLDFVFRDRHGGGSASYALPIALQ